MSLLGTIRASSWSTLFDCAFKWQRIYIDGVHSPSGARAWMGTSVHAGTAAFDQAVINGEPIQIDDAVGVALDQLAHPNEDVAWDNELTQRTAEPIVNRLTAMYCRDEAPKREFVAVERQYEALDIETEHGVLRVTGKVDREEKKAAGNGVLDLKTGFRIVSKDGGINLKDQYIQTGIYRFMAGDGTPLPGKSGILGASTGKEPKFGYAEIEDDVTPLVGNDQYPGFVDMAARMLKAGLFPPNPRSMTCSPKYCPAWATCPYRAQTNPNV